MTIRGRIAQWIAGAKFRVLPVACPVCGGRAVLRTGMGVYFPCGECSGTGNVLKDGAERNSIKDRDFMVSR